MVKVPPDVSDAVEKMAGDHKPKKKKRHSDQSLDSSALATEENKNLVSNVISQYDDGSCITPTKNKKKKHSYDAHDTVISDLKENGINIKANGDTVDGGAVDQKSCETKHKKKKKKHVEESDEVVNTLTKEIQGSREMVAGEVPDEGEQTENNELAVENEGRTPHKKKKKRKERESSEHKMEHVVPDTGDELFSLKNINDEEPHTTEGFTVAGQVKEKRKSKVSKSKLISEVTDDMTSESLNVKGTSEPVPEEEPTRKKKKKKHSDKSSEEVAPQDTAGGESDVSTVTSQTDAGSGIPLKSKKKRHSHDACDLVDNADNLDTQESEVKHKTKKKKKHSLDADVLVDSTSKEDIEPNEHKQFHSLGDSAVDEEDCKAPGKKNRKQKRKAKDLEESTEQMSDDTKTAQTFTFSFFSKGESLGAVNKEKNSEVAQRESEQKKGNYVASFGDVGSPHKKKKRKESESFKQETPEMEEFTPKMGPRIPAWEERRPGMKQAPEMKERISDQEMSEGSEGLPENTDEWAPAEDEDGDGRSQTAGGFTIIDQVKEIRKTRVDRVLPEWLSNPTTVSMNLGEGVPLEDVAGLDPFLSKCLHRERIEKFFPIQAAVIPELLSSSNPVSMRFRPRDVCVSAPTGSGKTLAYVLPIVQALRKRVVPKLRALILLPTQELAVQVHNVIEKFVRFSNLKMCLAVGSHSFKKEQNTLVFQDSSGTCSADILIATPGRLADHVNSTVGLTFKHLRFLVVDEADLFLSASGGDMMLKIEQLKKHIHRPLPDNSLICGGFCSRDSINLPEFYMQQVLISATLMHDPEQLKVLDLYRPKLFIARKEDRINKGTVVPYLRPDELREEYVYVEPSLKPLVLYHLIHTHKLRRVLVFTKSTMSTKTLAIFLSAMSSNYKVAKISSKESNRKDIVAQFSRGKIDVLISSDVMARGLDLTRINQVVSYDVPSLQNYVHRIGRTGRAGKQGFALSLVENTTEIRRDFKAILTSCEGRLHKIEVHERELFHYESQYQAALATLKETMSKEKKTEKAHKLKAKLERIKKPKKK